MTWIIIINRKIDYISQNSPNVYINTEFTRVFSYTTLEFSNSPRFHYGFPDVTLSGPNTSKRAPTTPDAAEKHIRYFIANDSRLADRWKVRRLLRMSQAKCTCYHIWSRSQFIWRFRPGERLFNHGNWGNRTVTAGGCRSNNVQLWGERVGAHRKGLERKPSPSESQGRDQTRTHRHCNQRVCLRYTSWSQRLHGLTHSPDICAYRWFWTTTQHLPQSMREIWNTSTADKDGRKRWLCKHWSFSTSQFGLFSFSDQSPLLRGT